MSVVIVPVPPSRAVAGVIALCIVAVVPLAFFAVFRNLYIEGGVVALAVGLAAVAAGVVVTVWGISRARRRSREGRRLASVVMGVLIVTSGLGILGGTLVGSVAYLQRLEAQAAEPQLALPSESWLPLALDSQVAAWHSFTRLCNPSFRTNGSKDALSAEQYATLSRVDRVQYLTGGSFVWQTDTIPYRRVPLAPGRDRPEFCATAEAAQQFFGLDLTGLLEERFALAQGTARALNADGPEAIDYPGCARPAGLLVKHVRCAWVPYTDWDVEAWMRADGLTLDADAWLEASPEQRRETAVLQTARKRPIAFEDLGAIRPQLDPTPENFALAFDDLLSETQFTPRSCQFDTFCAKLMVAGLDLF